MVFSIIVNYIFGILIDKYRKKSKLILFGAVLFNLAILGYFKYYMFIADNINGIFRHTVVPLKSIILPIGISFYTFQVLSYVIDLYRDNIKVQKNLLDLALYISFFPQLIAGPIVKYKDVEKEIKSRKVDISLFASGVKRFTYGLGKKVILANSLALVVDTIYAKDIATLNSPILWLAAISYTLQIYFDFSGYSDMAIGLGRMFGFHFCENFNLPYISQSITEFWRRWHISLSTWFKEYLYIPLGGNRKGKIRTYINLIIVFFATGLWHGASYNFIVWGLYYGVFLIIEKAFFKKFLDNNKFKLLNHIYVLLIVIVGWVLFRADDLNQAFQIIKTMFSFNLNTIYINIPQIVNKRSIFILLLAIIVSGPAQMLLGKLKSTEKLKKIYENKLEFIFIGIILLLSISQLISSEYNPFIYFRF